MSEPCPRRATEDDVDGINRLVVAAFGKYVQRIGKPPAPMTADRDARELGLPEIRLCTNEAMTENLEFYPRRGFHETGRGVQDGSHRVFFAKTL